MERGESVLLENRPVRLERQGQRADTYVTFDVSPVRMGDGSIAGALASLVATTATKAVGVLRERTLIEIADTGEQTRRDRAETFPKSFLLSWIGTVVSELPDGAIVEVNEGFTAATGYRADEAMGRTLRDLDLWVDDMERAEMLTAIEQGRRVESREFRFRRRDGSEILCLVSAGAITIGGVRCLVATFVDVTK